MAAYETFKPFDELGDPKNALKVSAERLKSYKSKKLKLLKTLAPLKSPISFMLRTLHDYAYSKIEPSRYQTLMLEAWEGAGLTKDSASRTLTRLYALGPPLVANLDAKYFSTPSRDIDKRLFVDIAKIDWKKYFNSPNVVSPERISTALETKSDKKLTENEKNFIRGYMHAFRKKSWAKLVKDKDAYEALNRLVKFPQQRYYAADSRYGRTIALKHTEGKFRIDDVSSPYHNEAVTSEALTSHLIPQITEDPSKQVVCYDWWLWRLGHRIASYSEKTGDDPVFIYSAYVCSDTTPPIKIAGPEVYKPADDEKHSNFRESFSRIHPPLPGAIPSPRRNTFLANEYIVFRLDAIEDDQWFDDDTAGYIDFGFDIANQITLLDPTGVTGIVIAIGEIAWSLIKFLDWLDDDDYVGKYVFHLHPSHLPVEEDMYPWGFVRDLTIYNRPYVWSFRIQNVVQNVVLG
jgi:hypothetical protein